MSKSDRDGSGHRKDDVSVADAPCYSDGQLRSGGHLKAEKGMIYPF